MKKMEEKNNMENVASQIMMRNKKKNMNLQRWHEDQVYKEQLIIAPCILSYNYAPSGFR